MDAPLEAVVEAPVAAPVTLTEESVATDEPVAAEVSTDQPQLPEPVRLP